MKALAASLLFTLLIAPAALAQPAPTAAPEEVPSAEDAEVVIVVGPRRRFQLRLTLQNAERDVYAVFNEFNDEPRFNITCTRQLRYASHIEGEALLCQPEFELQAQRAEAQDSVEALRDRQNPVEIFYDKQNSLAGTGANTQAQPAGAAINAAQAAYRSKMRQIAEEHAEFREALIKYVELKNIYLDINARKEEE